MSDWTPTMKAVVASVKTTVYNRVVGDGKQEEALDELRMWDKVRNLENLLKHLGLLSRSYTWTGASPAPNRKNRMVVNPTPDAASNIFPERRWERWHNVKLFVRKRNRFFVAGSM